MRKPEEIQERMNFLMSNLQKADAALLSKGEAESLDIKIKKLVIAAKLDVLEWIKGGEW